LTMAENRWQKCMSIGKQGLLLSLNGTISVCCYKVGICRTRNECGKIFSKTY
jgi:hypothetical protein